MRIDGHCHCGRIAFEAEVDPEAATICHCTDCQTLSGSPFRASIPAPAAQFSLRGEPKAYLKIADSGARRVQAFCGECGTPIYSCAPENAEVYHLRLGAIAQRQALAPRRQIWRRSALAWTDGLANLPAIDRDSD